MKYKHWLMPFAFLLTVVFVSILSMGLLISIAMFGANKCSETACIHIVDRSLLDFTGTGQDMIDQGWFAPRPGMVYDEKYPQHYR